MKKKILIYLLLLVIPISLYINFFIAKKTLWDMHIKAWLIYSTLIMAGELLIILLFEFLIPKLLKKLKLSTDKDNSKFINISIIAFLSGNIFFIFPWHSVLWLFVPIFQGMLIFVSLNIYLKAKADIKKSWKKRLFTLEKASSKTTDGSKRKSHIFIILFVVLFFVGMNVGFLYKNIIQYNPYVKSLNYFVPKARVIENPYRPIFPF